MAKLEDLMTWPSIREVCQLAGICQNTGYNWVWQKKVQAVQVFGAWRVNPKDVERIRQQRAERRATREARNGNR
jgi:predicted site-specific integrase-resolvase